jgi:hypothetical protein
MSWKRAYLLTVGKPGGQGFQTGDLHISFSVSRSEDKSGNSATLEIWNLNPDHQELITQKDCFVKLDAGYEDSELITIFTGYVTYGDGELDGADWKTSLELVDGRVPVRDTFQSKSYSGATNTKKVIDDVGAAMGFPVEFGDGVQFKDLPSGYSFVGQAAKSLDKACAASDLEWYVDNDTLHIKAKGKPKNRQVYEISPETGLIGYPKKVTKSGESDEDKDVVGYEVTYFLNAAIGVGDYVYLNSKVTKGYFRVQSLKIDGDNLSGDWVCAATLMKE